MATNVLLSYAHFGNEDLAPLRKRLTCGRILIDSGAFTAYRQGTKIDLVEYATWLTDRHGLWDHAVTLDKIGDPAQTRLNTRRLHDMGIPVLPVFTAGESLVEFDAMVRDSGYIMVGGGVGMTPALLVKRIGVLQHRARELGGGIHALGMGAMWQLRKTRPYSSDSSNLGNAFRYGVLHCWNGSELKNIPVRDKAAVRGASDWLRKAGWDVASIVNSGMMCESNPVGRTAAMKALTLAYATADEVLTQTYQTPVPHGTDDIPGPHLYAALVPTLFEGVAQASDAIHSANPPAVYQPYKAGHICTGGSHAR